MDIQESLQDPDMRGLIRGLVEKATSHSPLQGTEEKYLYSVLPVTLPVSELMYKTIQMTRKVVAEGGADIQNEEQGAVEFFTNLIMFILKAADSVEQDVYADDDEVYDVVVGKSTIFINRERLGMPRLYESGGSVKLDLTRDEQ